VRAFSNSLHIYDRIPQIGMGSFGHSYITSPQIVSGQSVSIDAVMLGTGSWVDLILE
jgi:hypothetical protein